MASLIPAGSATGTGSVTLTVPITNNTQTATLPDATGTVMVSGAMPTFSAYLSSIQSVTTSTYSKVQINSVIFDTSSAFNTSTFRYTPLVAGYYQINGAINPNTTTTSLTALIYKNGVAVSAGQGTSASATTSTIVFLNGSTDYIELYAYLVGVTPAIYGASNNPYTIFSASLIRAA